MDRAQADAAYRADLRLAEAAQAVLENEAVMAYFDAVEAKAIDAMLACEPVQDLERLRLAVVAGTVRQFRQFLRAGVASGEYAAQALGQNQQGERSGA